MHGLGRSGLLVLEEIYFFLISSWTPYFQYMVQLISLLLPSTLDNPEDKCPSVLGEGNSLSVLVPRVEEKANFLSLRSTEGGARSARNASAWTEAKSLEFVSDWLLVRSSNLPKSMT